VLVCAWDSSGSALAARKVSKANPEINAFIKGAPNSSNDS
jgi:hypothetical protein